MNLDTAKKVMVIYRDTLEDFGPKDSGGAEGAVGHEPEPGPFDRPPEESELNTHLYTMLDSMDDFLERVETMDDQGVDFTEVWEKFNRWLGFMQGVFWVQGDYTLNEMREHNTDE